MSKQENDIYKLDNSELSAGAVDRDRQFSSQHISEIVNEFDGIQSKIDELNKVLEFLKIRELTLEVKKKSPGIFYRFSGQTIDSIIRELNDIRNQIKEKKRRRVKLRR